MCGRPPGRRGVARAEVAEDFPTLVPSVSYPEVVHLAVSSPMVRFALTCVLATADEWRRRGPWNVGITGTPKVDVTNPSNAPVFFLNVNDPGGIPYQPQSIGGGDSIDCDLPDSCTFPFPAAPAGHGLVVQRGGGFLDYGAVPATRGVFLVGEGARSLAEFMISLTNIDTMFDQPVVAYFDAGQTRSKPSCKRDAALRGNVVTGGKRYQPSAGGFQGERRTRVERQTD